VSRLVGSEMCIRDRDLTTLDDPAGIEQVRSAISGG
jgi:hypothetical protein